ncbi:MAG: MBOAT family protein [Clostridia bacterium]|nr:MBOAT family protein [Clostridia bacterium]
MVFSSLTFLLAFIPAVFICCFFCKTTAARNIVLLVFSLIFYAFGEPVYIAVLVFLSLCCWIFARLTELAGSKKEKKLWLTASVAVCILSLMYFGGSDFLIKIINSLAGAELFSATVTALPLGMSFYILRLISYSVDVYKGKASAQKRFYKVLLYASLFPLAVSGPVVLFHETENELTERSISLKDVSNGLTRFATGLAKKVILADGCAVAANSLLFPGASLSDTALLSENVAALSGKSALSLWAGAVFFMLQIYLELSSYSDIATGLGLASGFHFKENFNYPFTASSFSDFCEKWHISLISFFRDYIYSPLCEAKSGKLRQISALFITCILVSLWHGLSSSFLLLGIGAFILLAAENFIFAKIKDKCKPIGRIYLLITVFFGFILFRADSIAVFINTVKGMLCLNNNPLYTKVALNFIAGYAVLFILSIIACTPLIKIIKKNLIKAGENNLFANVIYRVCDIASPAVLIILSVLYMAASPEKAFGYFGF